MGPGASTYPFILDEIIYRPLGKPLIHYPLHQLPFLKISPWEMGITSFLLQGSLPLHLSCPPLTTSKGMGVEIHIELYTFLGINDYDLRWWRKWIFGARDGI